MRVIFLDIDGVIASLDYLRIIGLLEEKNPDKYGYAFDPRCVKNLKYILQQCPEVKLVISSTWKSFGISKLLDMWKIRDLPGEIIDITPNISDVRGEEIAEWLSQNPFVTNYVIIDDDSDMLSSQMNNFIKTDPLFGLTVNDSKKVIKVLNG